MTADLPREEYTSWLSSAEQSIQETCIHVTLYRMTNLYLVIYTYMDIYECNTYIYVHICVK